MKIEFQRWVDRWLGVPACRILTPLAPLLSRKVAEPRNILVILLSEMGSLVLAVPMFDRIRARYPNATVHALLFDRNREVLGLIDRVAPENMLTIRDTSLGVFLADILRATRRMRARRIDAVLDCELFSRVSSVLSLMSGAGLRAGFHRHRQEGLYRGGFITCPVLYNPYVHISAQFVNLAEALDARGMPRIKVPAARALSEPPRVRMEATEIEGYRQALRRDFPNVEQERIVLVYPGGGLLPIRAWPEASYRELCRELTARGWTVGVTGMAGDTPLAQRILAECPPSRRLDLTGYTKSLRHLVGLFHVARLLITNDGGPGHFASLTPIRTIMLFGPESPVLYGPLGQGAKVFFSGLTCSPCLTAYNHRNSPCDGHNVCLKVITPKQVLDAALEMLGVQPAA